MTKRMADDGGASVLWEAAGTPQSLGFALVGAPLIIPVMLVYTAFSYWVFRRKLRAQDGHH